MKKVLLFLILYVVSFATLTHKEVTTGEYKGFNKISGFTDSDKFDVYVKVVRKGNMIYNDIKIIPNYKKVDLKEKLSINYKGKNITHTRKEWYDLISNTTGGNEFGLSVIERNFPDLFKDFEDNNIFAYEYEINRYIRDELELSAPNETVSEIKKDDSFCNDPNISAKDRKLCNAVSEQEHLEKMSESVKTKNNDKTDKLEKAANFLLKIIPF
jgi:hypothetical protein